MVFIGALRDGYFLAHFVSFFIYALLHLIYELCPKILPNERPY